MTVPILDAGRWERAQELARAWTVAGTIPALTMVTGTRQQLVGPVHFGLLSATETVPLPASPLYLIASITKPLVAMAALTLMERGELALADRVVDFLPEFGKQGKYGVEVRHLLTHTSGLPDMLPNNRELRAAHAPLAEFVTETCQHGLAFPPGRGVQYQSMGFAILGEIIARVSGRSCAELLQTEVFAPLGMTDSVLGAPDEWFKATSSPLNRLVEVRLPQEQSTTTDWHWNSRYWRQLGAPWGGLLTTADDLAKLAQTLLRDGRSAEGQAVWSPATTEAATRNQLAAMREVPEDERRCRPWGLGWRLNWPAHSANFGDLLSPASYGHWGATGTVLWIDPARGVFAVILTTQPQEPAGGLLAKLSNVLASAWT